MPSTSNKVKTASLTIDFIVVGGSIAGFATALGLSRAGHRVTLLEEYDASKHATGGARSPPNMTKIMEARWGLGQELEKISLRSDKVSILNFETGDVFGSHQWDEELMRQTGGLYTVMRQSDLVNMLAVNAESHGAQIRYNARVVQMTKGSIKGGIKPSVTLASGETLSADIIVGADGPDSTVRRFLLGDTRLGEPTGLLLWDTLVPWNVLEEDPELSDLAEGKDVLCSWFGPRHAAITYPVRGSAGYNLALHVWSPDDGTLTDPGRGSWRERYPASMLVNAMHDCDPRLAKLARSGKSATCVRSFDTPSFEDWVTPDKPVVLIGEAAHPLVAGAMESHAMTIEDAACLAELFTHLKALDQVATFLDAFEEVRRPRVESIRENEAFNIHFMTLPQGQDRDARDEVLRVGHESGKGVLNAEAAYGEVLKVYAYDAIDEATDWWMKYGILKERHIGRVDETLDVKIEQRVVE
ncbi:FAD/NAD(P)-binding domain-containing protein [Heliocybe sulcata]|uniref:FAD/NAD(P)-binding domain-containing protein n=1 Tax=Heliocybe sulcata TaxID=5364 RepID=A0A5C3NDB2_9AGAM|nr:FAD/NAD(P)-binding domain-containing protein [Heliocybe sulcata]